MTTENSPSPLIIPRSEHPISRSNIDREALKVMHRLRDAGFAAYLVGGGVRDIFLGKQPKDFDISTDAKPGQLRKLFRNSRIIGKRFRLVQVFFHGEKIVEVSTFRRRSEYDINGNEMVLAENNTFGTAVDDAFRRDLTINGLFYDIENFSVIDYVGGVQDIKDRVIRLIGDPERRITRDPGRMLRVIRHAARSGFAIEEKTWEATRKHRQMLTLCPVSRIRDEMLKDLRSGAARSWAMLAIASGLFSVIFPFYEGLVPASQEGMDLPPPDASSPCSLLLNILGVIDRLQGQSKDIPETLLLALLLIPWAQSELALITAGRQPQDRETFALSQKLRLRLDQALAHLNIKRVTIELIATLLVNLAVFEKYSSQEWPAWLSRKSYFMDGLQLFQFYREALGGLPVEEVRPSPALKAKPKTSEIRRRGRVPLFAEKSKGGVFGFRRK